MIKLKFNRRKYNGYNTLEMEHEGVVKLSDVLHIYDKDGNFIGIFDKEYGKPQMQLTLMEGAYAMSGSHMDKMS